MFLVTPRTTAELFKRKSEKGDFPVSVSINMQAGTLLSLPTTRCLSEDTEPPGPLRPHSRPLSASSTILKLGGTVSKTLSRNFLGPFSLSLPFRGKHRELESREGPKESKVRTIW